MKPFSLNDPDLAALETELLGQNPRLDNAARQALLYQAAFRAGKAKATRTTRLWQVYSVTLALILAVTLFPWDRSGTGPQTNPNQMFPGNIPLMITAAPKEDLPLGAHGDQGTFSTFGDAWTQDPNKSERFDQELEKFAQLDPREKACSLIQFSHLEFLGH